MKIPGRRIEENQTRHTAASVEESAPQTEQLEQEKQFSEVEPLSEDFLRNLSKWGVDGGKYIRLGDTIFVSSGPKQGFAGKGLTYKEIFEQAKAMKNSDVKKMPLDAQALQGAKEETIEPDYMIDAGDALEDGIQGGFRVFSAPGDFGIADKESRERTVQIAAQTLGSHIRVEYAKYMDSLSPYFF
jgi:hypothetical protein